jgi:ABC-type transport system involved in multi-copper enzyme maturation permease subunit
MAASALGALILLLIGAGHIGGEWSYRTIKSVLVVDPRRIRFAISKWLSLWLIGIVALAIAWGGLSALGFFQQRIYELPASAGDGVAWSDAASHVMRAALVLGIYAALATLAGILTKNMLGAFFVSFGIIIASQIAAAFPAMKSWTLGHWVGAFMPFTPHKLYYSYIWYPDFPGGASGEMQTAVWGLVTLFVLCATVSLLRITHSDIE